MGLADLDEWDCACQCVYCTDDDSNNNGNCTYLGHHEEALMGYGEHANRTLHITYRDIAGVSITRGFHTDNDHLWMLRENTNEITNEIESMDVICALCNGVRFAVEDSITIDAGVYYYENKEALLYGSCNEEHSINGNNMILVASDGERDFYKCRCCRYIEEVEIEYVGSVPQHSSVSKNLVLFEEQCYKINIKYPGYYNVKIISANASNLQLYNSSWESIDMNSNNVFSSNGEDVNLSKGVYYLRMSNSSSSIVNFNLTIRSRIMHSFTDWTPYSPTQHIECCECGATGTVKRNHVVKSSDIDGIKSKCLICDALIDPVYGFGESFIQNISKVTINGSYILPNGIIVLVDEDIEAYFNGTLIFYDKNNLPQTQ